MLRIHVIAWLMSANDRQTEDLLIDSVSVCAFCRLDETGPRPPDAETIGNFRRRLERSGLQDIIHSHLMAELTKKGVSLMPGGIVEPRWIGPLM
jgi:IS5 family transposase